MTQGLAITQSDRQERYTVLSTDSREFDFSWPVKRSSDLSVLRERDGNVEVLALDADYSLYGVGVENGGYIRLLEAPLVNDVIDLFGLRDLERGASFTRGGLFTAKAIEAEFNNVYISLQEMRRDVDQGVKRPTWSGLSNPLPIDLDVVLGLSPDGRSISFARDEFSGPAGAQGAAGSQGPAGVPGAQGGAGSQGPAGVPGLQGPTGAQGLVGDQGAIGSTGAQGVQGVTGETGATGGEGVQGVPGAIGPAGQLPSVIAQTDNGCMIGLIDDGYVNQPDAFCDQAELFALTRTPGVLGYDIDLNLMVYPHGDFVGAQGVPGPAGPVGGLGPIGPEGPAGPVGPQGDGASNAIDVSFTPFGHIEADNLQAAVEEMVNEKLSPDDVVDDGYIVSSAPLMQIDFSSQAILNGSPVAIAGLVSCTRASSGYARLLDGSLAEFAANDLRITDKGLLAEEARTNLLSHSQEFDAAWNAYQAVLTNNQAAAPDGTQTAGKAAYTNVGGHAYRNGLANKASVAAGQTYQYSLYSRAETGMHTFKMAATNGQAWLTSSVSDEIPSDENWERHVLQRVADGGDIYLDPIFGAESKTPWVMPSSGSIYVWGAQVEEGEFPTSYIKTDASPATRAADAIQFSDLSWLDATKGTFLIEVEAVPADGAALLGYDGGNSLLARGTGVTQAKTDNGSVVLTAMAGSGGFDGVSRLAIAWDATGRSLCFNGGVVSMDSHPVGTLSRLDLGSLLGVSEFANTHIRALSYWPKRKSDADVQAVSA